MNSHSAPLAGIQVVDFTTLAPGPFASLMLAAAGATVIKIERPDCGDEMRSYKHAFGDNGATFSILNAGKRSIAANLKDGDTLRNIKKLIGRSDIVIEQFRPGVMAKLGLGYESLAKETPGLVYCSISGFGQHGPKSQVAAHDLNYVADAGMLSLGECPGQKPTVPSLLAADLAAGSYPAMINILLALAKRARTGEGAYIDISMTDNLFPLMFWALGLGWGTGAWPGGGNELLSSGSPRYQVYETSDKRHIAVAALEQRFWLNFCEAIEFDQGSIDEKDDPADAIKQVSLKIREHTAAQWAERFAGKDVCAVVVNSLQEAIQDRHYQARGLFEQQIINEDGNLINALPLPIVRSLQIDAANKLSVPAVGEFNEEYWNNETGCIAS